MKKNNFFDQLKKNFRSKEVIVAFIATISLLILFRIGATVALPTVKINTQNENSAPQTIFDLMNLLGGAGAGQLSLFAVGISPYITSQIIVQLLSSSELIKPLSRLSKSGEKGRRKIEVISRTLTIPFAIAQAYAIFSLSMSSGRITIGGATTIQDVPQGTIWLIILALVSGSLIALFISDIITKKGIGNGITLIILSGIITSIYPNFQQVFMGLTANSSGNPEQQMLSYLAFFGYIILFIILLLLVVYINSSTRKIPIQQIGQGFTSDIDEMPYLPIKINSAGVIPVIFASSLMSIPTTIVQFLGSSSSEATKIIEQYFGLTSITGLMIYSILVLLFTFFYSYIQLNPEELANNFKKSGRYIPGVSSGKTTEKYISQILIRINCIGAPYLMVVSSIPYIISMTTGIPSGIAIGGTGIIIIVSGSLDFWQSTCSAQTKYSYSRTKKNIEQEYVSSKSSEKNITHLW